MSCRCGGGGSDGGFIGISNLGYLEKSTTSETMVCGVTVMKMCHEGPESLDQKSFGADQKKYRKQCKSSNCCCK